MKVLNMEETNSKYLNWQKIKSKTDWVFSNLNGTILTSRIRIARNIKGYPFPYNMTCEKAEEIEKLITDVFLKYPSKEIFIIDIKSLSEEEKEFLISRHLISKEFAESGISNKLIIIFEKKTTIMINEEDHLRIQTIFSGLNLKKCWKNINEIDNFIDKNIEYAFLPDLGFLTSCPTNIGTGLRCSILVHIPGIKFLKRDMKIFKLLERIGIAIRGFYGEGTNPCGYIYQLSTIETTGKKEKDIIKELESIAEVIDEEEKNAKEEIKNDRKLRDKLLKELRKILNEKEKRWWELFSLFCLGNKIGVFKLKKNEIRNMFKSLLFEEKNGKFLREIFNKKLREKEVEKIIV